ncbi:hypothetical protein BS47DRAFT_1360991 [Hydnum rufescens UP504]|uniref:Uncharacterized protein n=1 Tax=Hydnum rufescens UP504 TaxID=1448309 RepID=A0A9P6B0V9_9AGAM|nr:hypothetical protein BS47DRAFT_1360991 [Hydnum rufescens UP504]
MCAATRNPIQEPSTRTPTTYMTMDEIQYHMPPVGCLFSNYETPPKASTYEAQGVVKSNYPHPHKVCPIRRPMRPHTKQHTAAKHPPSAQHPNAHNLRDGRSSTIPHTHCSGCVVISVPLPARKPPTNTQPPKTMPEGPAPNTATSVTMDKAQWGSTGLSTHKYPPSENTKRSSKI